MSKFLLEIKAYAVENHIPVILDETAKLYKTLLQIIMPERILEIGSAIGYSSIFAAYTLKELKELKELNDLNDNKACKIDTIEINGDMCIEARKNIAKAGMDDIINVICGDASDVLKCLDTKYDLIFLDAAKGQYCEFLEDCIRLTDAGGLLISDNVLYKGMIKGGVSVPRRKRTIVSRMNEYIDKITHDSRLRSCIKNIGDGVALSYRL